jgi:hypothetical protein
MSGFSKQEVKRLLSPHERLLGKAVCQLEDIANNTSPENPEAEAPFLLLSEPDPVTGNSPTLFIRTYSEGGPVDTDLTGAAYTVNDESRVTQPPDIGTTVDMFVAIEDDALEGAFSKGDFIKKIVFSNASDPTSGYADVIYYNYSNGTPDTSIIYGSFGGVVVSPRAVAPVLGTEILTVEQVSQIDPSIAVEKGYVSGQKLVNKFGTVFNIGPETFPAGIDVWPDASEYGKYSGSASFLTIVSTSDSDIFEDEDGAGQIEVFGLDEDYNEISELVNLNGITPVLTTNKYMRANRAVVTDSEDGDGNYGTITAEFQAIPGLVAFVMRPFDNQTLLAVYTVPAGKTFYMNSIEVDMARINGSAGSAQVSLRARPFGPKTVYNSKLFTVVSDSSPLRPNLLNSPMVFSEKTDIKVSVEQVSDSNTTISAYFSGYLVDD